VTEQSGAPFIGQRRGSGKVTSGGGARRSQIKGREREVAGGGLELRGAHKARWRVRISRGSGIQRGALWGPAAALPRFFGQIMVRGGKGERGEGKWELCRASRASGQPQGGQVGGWTSCPLA
jgi:hypothetical protein